MLSFWGHGWGVNINWRERVARGGLVDGCRVFLVDHSKSFYGCTFLVELRDLAKFPRNKQRKGEWPMTSPTEGGPGGHPPRHSHVPPPPKARAKQFSLESSWSSHSKDSLLSNIMPADLKRHLCIYYITGHGFGHATRAIGLVEKLLECGFVVEIVSTLQQDFFLETMSVDSSQLSLHLRYPHVVSMLEQFN